MAKTTPTKTQPPGERARRACMQNSRGTSATNQLAGLSGVAVSAGLFSMSLDVLLYFLV